MISLYLCYHFRMTGLKVDRAAMFVLCSIASLRFAFQNFFLKKSLISWERSSLLDFQKSLIFTFLDKWVIFEIGKWTTSSSNEWFLEEEVSNRKHCNDSFKQFLYLNSIHYFLLLIERFRTLVFDTENYEVLDEIGFYRLIIILLLWLGI